jgi:hypothetical protein
MRVRAFVPWSLLGTAAWATTFTLVGYVFHASFSAAAELLTRGALVLAVLAAAVLLVRHRRAVARQQRRPGSPRSRRRVPAAPGAGYRIPRLLRLMTSPAVSFVTKLGPVGMTRPSAANSPNRTRWVSSMIGR